MTANNEIGVIQPIAEIGTIARRRDPLPHRRCAGGRQGAFDVTALKVDLVSISGHKIYGPKVWRPLCPAAQSARAAGRADQRRRHERGMRSGTLNVTGIVGLGKAAQLCQQEMEKDNRAAAQASRSAERALHRTSTRSTSTAPWSTGSRTTSISALPTSKVNRC